ncbi:hypothetical protein MMC11_007821 [Xylographa trunciseda]|nr:hypothetical protein [Xylographa trunciseda]
MSAYQAASLVQLMPMPQLAEAVDGEDDWTGLTDAVARRKRQNRLNVRAYRRRKALELRAYPASFFTSGSTSGSTSGTSVAKTLTGIPCWVDDQQTVSILPASVANGLNRVGVPLILYQPATSNPATSDRSPPARIIFPLTRDHLITLLQFNVLRGCLTNRRLLSRLIPVPPNESSSAVLQTLPTPSFPQAIPPSLYPTLLQRTVPHEAWIDIIPHPVWRDNVIMATGKFDEDELWADTIGGLFEGFSNSEMEQHGVIAWSPPWQISGWEVSAGFWRKWEWSFTGCVEVLEATNSWRKERGEDPLVFKV